MGQDLNDDSGGATALNRTLELNQKGGPSFIFLNANAAKPAETGSLG
jgi:hypothetical protein